MHKVQHIQNRNSMEGQIAVKMLPLHLDSSENAWRTHASIVTVPPFQHLLRLCLEQELISSILPCKIDQETSPAKLC